MMNKEFPVLFNKGSILKPGKEINHYPLIIQDIKIPRFARDDSVFVG